MAATSHVTQPNKKHLSHDEPYQSNNYGSYDTGFGSMTSHSYQYQRDQPPLSDHSNTNTTKSNEKYGTTKTTQLPTNKTKENQQLNSMKQKQNPPATLDNQPPTLVRSERQIPQSTAPKQQNKSQKKTTKAAGQTDLNQTQPFESNSHVDMKATKSSVMRAKAIKKKEAALEQKRKNQYFASKLKSQLSHSPSDDDDEEQQPPPPPKVVPKKIKPNKNSLSEGEQTDVDKSNRQKKSSYSQPRPRKSRVDGYKTEDKSSGDEENQKPKRNRSKSQKRTTFSDSQLPPLRQSRLPPYQDPYFDYMLPPGHPLRSRYAHYDDYPPRYGGYARRHVREEAEDIPPYLASYRDPYDHFFDYEKRKVNVRRSKSKTDGHADRDDNNGYLTGYETERDEGTKSQVSRKVKSRNANNERKARQGYWNEYYGSSYYDENAMLEIWRQERNDYLKKKYKPTIHDVLYSQQWMKSDSYLENQRRRALRDSQGYYFPYKKYTLKDYRDMQKTNNANPFAETNEMTIDRKERQKKRQEYGALVERQMADNPGARHVPPRDMLQRKPWHLSGGDPLDIEAISKRERALEYAKDQVKYRPVINSKSRSHQYENNPYDENDGNNYDRTNNPHQSYDDYD